MYALDAFTTVWDNFEKHAENFADELIPFAFRFLIGIIVFAIIWRVGRMAQRRVERGVMRAGGEIATARLVSKVVFYAVALIAFSVFLGFLGVREAAIAVVLGAGALAITLSLQDLLRNVVAGVYVAVERPFDIGSRVRVADQTGTIEDIGVRVTRMRTDEGSEVLVPNLVFFTSPVTRLIVEEPEPMPSAPSGN
ncbi:MAG: mechanosensitive ion channel domain-containing protein [Dehalococcoidia bacterium]